MSGSNRGCTARQCSDQMNCDRCGLVWDMNDPEPPECPGKAETRPTHELRAGRPYGRGRREQPIAAIATDMYVVAHLTQVKTILRQIADASGKSIGQVSADLISNMLLSDTDNRFHIDGIEFMKHCGDSLIASTGKYGD